mmetsp:Transcript_11387/g.18647  ORF Transcript_11387/g.18647 Transcript_11387/m.18647 type:complete len:87 (-) Transcript_11387:671-931(-)
MYSYVCALLLHRYVEEEHFTTATATATGTGTLQVSYAYVHGLFYSIRGIRARRFEEDRSIKIRIDLDGIRSGRISDTRAKSAQVPS